MCRFLILMTVLAAWVGGQAEAGPPGQQQPPKPPPAVAALLKLTPRQFIQRFDKNKDGYLTKDELPPRFANAFDRLDSNGDGQLDAQEVQRLLMVLRKRFGVSGPNQPAPGKGAAKGTDPAVERFVNRVLREMDKNEDGKISRDEAQRRVRAAFDRFDANRDGYLDKNELRQMAARFLAQQAGGPRGGQPQGAARLGPDFDALDKNADGRLTRDELKGTPFYPAFDRIDRNKDGKITPKEFDAYLKQEAAAKEKAAEKK
jgi:Ca2+-binding EF-hand superfamily protein